MPGPSVNQGGGVAIRAASAARRRLLLRDGMRLGGIAMCAGTGVGLGLVTAERMFGFAARVGGGVSWWWLAAAPVGLAALIGAGIAMRRRGSLVAAAQYLDRTLGLRDRISSAVALRGPLAEPLSSAAAFADTAVLDGEAVAATINVRRAVPAPAPGTWWAWPLLLAGTLAVGIYLPQMNLLNSPPAPRELLAAEARDRQDVAREISSATELVQPEAQPERDATQSPEVREKLAALEEIERQLKAGQRTPEEARREAARSVNDLAERLAKSAEASRRTTDAVRSSLAAAGAAGSDAAPSQSGSGRYGEGQLTRALRAGDLQAAREAVESLRERLPEISPEEREATAAAMERYAEDLEALSRQAEQQHERDAAEAQAAGAGDRPEPQTTPPGVPAAQPDKSAPPEPNAIEPSNELQRDLQKQGLSESQARRAAQQPDKDSAKRELEQSGIEPEAAERLAERINQEREQREARREAEEKTERLARDLREAAKSIREPNRDPPQSPEERGTPDHRQTEGGGSERNGAQTPQRSPESGGPRDQGRSNQVRPGEQSAPKEGSGRQSATKSGDSAREQQGERNESRQQPDGQTTQPGDRPGAGSQNPQDARQQPGAGTEPGERRDAQQQGNQPGSQPNQREGAEKAGEQPGDAGGAQRPGAEGQGKPADQPGEKTSPQSGAEPRKSPSEPSRDSTGGEKPTPKSGERGPGEQPSPHQAEQGAKGEGAGATPEQSTQPGSPPDMKKGPTGGAPDSAKQPNRTGDQPGARPQPAPGTAASKQQTTESGGPPEAKQDSNSTGGKSPDSSVTEPQSGREPEDPRDGNNDSLDRLAKQIRQLSNAEQGAQRDQRTSEELRERARQMYENADPQTRREMERWAREMAKQQRDQGGPTGPGQADAPIADGPRGGMNPSGPAGKNQSAPPSRPRDFRTEVVDARGDQKPGAPGRDRVVAEWLGDGKAGASESPADVESRLQEAARSAERAVDDRVVHSRYDKLLRRYFRRLPENVSPGAGAKEPPVQPAKDVP